MTETNVTAPAMTTGHGELSSRIALKRERIVEVAMRHFAEQGYHQARVQDIAAELGIAKGSVFQHFGSKERLFLAAYKRAVTSFPAWLDVAEDVRARGFFATVKYWLESTVDTLREDWVPYRVAIIGNYGTDLGLKRQINRFLVNDDPYRLAAFVRFGLERGELRRDVDLDFIASFLDWTWERFQDALLTEELDPGLFRRHGGRPERTEARIEEFLRVLRSAIGVLKPPPRPASNAKARAAKRRR
jgi:AcrR family transcriptional regulator